MYTERGNQIIETAALAILDEIEIREDQLAVVYHVGRYRTTPEEDWGTVRMMRLLDEARRIASDKLQLIILDIPDVPPCDHGYAILDAWHEFVNTQNPGSVVHCWATKGVTNGTGLTSPAQPGRRPRGYCNWGGVVRA